jgi:predicted house-cleaning noncanonical NTP pyrophosphatase (MazG superfamily)
MLPKLVRDGVPQSIAALGNTPVTRVAEVSDRKGWLMMKLQEEIDEFKLEGDPMELIDIYEALRGLWAICNPEADISLSSAAAIKREELGGFTEFFVLVNVQQDR